MLKNRLWPTALATSIVGFLGACGSPGPTADSGETAASSTPAAGGTGPTVVATTPVLCNLTQQIAAETINLICPIQPGTDPHVYEPTPADRKALEDAKLILYGGYDFEPSMIKLIQASSSDAPKVAVHEVAVPTPLKGGSNENGEEHQGEESEGEKAHGADEAEALDPHVWHDAKNGAKMAETITKSLTQLVPDQAALYQQNAQGVTQELAQLDTWIKAQVATIPPASRKLVTTHNAMGYYSQAYGIPVEGALGGISTEEKPTASRVAELVKVIQAAQVPTIFAELTINPKLIAAVAKDAKVKVSDRELFADGLGESGSAGATYQNMLIANTQTIVEGLGGKYTAFKAQ
jgi:manganese/iron transport system substrate-binding protein